jgi:uncharacterized protein
MNVVAGGGSSLTLPALIFLGLDTTLANGTNRIAVIVQNISAVYAFKQEKFFQFPLSMKLSLLTLPGAVLGAFIALDISDDLFQKILGVIMIGVIISMLIPNSKKSTDGHGKEKITFPVILSMIFIGFYGGFIQVGIGFMLMAALNRLMRLNLVYVNMHKVFIVLALTIPPLIVFWISGNVNWTLGLMLAAGNALGAWWAAKMSIKKGEKFIRYVLIAAILIMAMKLLDIF